MSERQQIAEDYGNMVSTDPDIVYIQVPRKLVPPGVATFELKLGEEGRQFFVPTPESAELIEAHARFLRAKEDYERLFFSELASLSSNSPRQDPENPFPEQIVPKFKDIVLKNVDPLVIEENHQIDEAIKKSIEESKQAEKMEQMEKEMVESVIKQSSKTYYGTRLLCNYENCPYKKDKDDIHYFYINDTKKKEYEMKNWPLPSICRTCTTIRFVLRKKLSKEKEDEELGKILEKLGKNKEELGKILEGLRKSKFE